MILFRPINLELFTGEAVKIDNSKREDEERRNLLSERIEGPEDWPIQLRICCGSQTHVAGSGNERSAVSK